MFVEVVGKRPRIDGCPDTHFIFQRGVTKAGDHFDNIRIYPSPTADPP